jgi:hypothetical protein
MDYTNNIRVIKDNSFYNVGDSFYGRGSWREIRSTLADNPEYEGTFLGEYFTMQPSKKKYGFERSLVNNAFKNLDFDKKYKLANDSLYVQLRMGDVVPYTFKPVADKVIRRVLQQRYNKLHVIYPNRVAHTANDHSTCCKSVKFVPTFTYSNGMWEFSKLSHDENLAYFKRFLIEFKRICKLPFSFLDVEESMKDIAYTDYMFYVLCKAPHVLIDRGGFGEVASEYRGGL